MKVKSNTVFKVGLLFIVLLLSSCVSRKEVVFFNNALDVAPTLMNDDSFVKIQPGDEITIRVSAPEQDGAQPYNLTKSLGGGDNAQSANVQLETYLVQKDGTIKFPEFGFIKVAGYTVVELARILEKKIAPFVTEPIVTVRIENFQISILGEVGSPGVKMVTGNQFSLPQALSLGGDLLITGKRDNILIMRKENGQMTYNYVDLTDAAVTQSPYYYLQQNDVIYVEPNTGQRQRAGILSTLSTYLGVASVVISLALIFTR